MGAGDVLRDTEELANRVRYGVVDEAAREGVTLVLDAAGVPCGLVLIHIQVPFRQLPGAETAGGTALG